MSRPKKRESLLESLNAEAEADAQRESEARRLLAAQRSADQLVAARSRIVDLERELKIAALHSECLAYLHANPLAPMQIGRRERGSAKHEACAVLVLSDLHLEETVDPSEINGLNEFNPTIAAERMDRLAVGVGWQLNMMRQTGPKDARAGYAIRDLLIMNLGDITTNYLRGEDMHGNALTPMEAIVFAGGLLVRFVCEVLHRCPWLESVRMPIVPGNHDRLSLTPRTPFRKRVGMSSAPILAHMIATELRDEPRFRAELSASEHVYIDVYNHRVRGMHGDRFRYLGGVGGIFVPARRHVAGLNKAIPAAITVFGHWHTSKTDDDWISNGSLIGPNAYTVGLGLDPEPPSQTLFLLDKRRGKRHVTPIQVGRKDEWS